MKNILVGNGINIQYDNENYTCKNIVLRVLTELDEDDYPCEYIVDNPMLIKSYMGKLFLAARKALDGGLDKYPNCTAERKGLNDFKDRYKSKKKSLRIADIGFEDYYLIHDFGQFIRNYTQTVKRAADNKRRYAPGEGSIPPVLLSGVSKGACPLAHDFAKQSVVCYTLCRRCRENAVAAGEGKGI